MKLCCFFHPLSSDHKVLGVLRVLRGGESSSALNALGRRGRWWGWPLPERIPASGWVGFLCHCSCWHKTLRDSLELMLHSTHPCSRGEPDALWCGEHSGVLSGLCWAQKEDGGGGPDPNRSQPLVGRGSCRHKTLHDSLELMLCSTHP